MFGMVVADDKDDIIEGIVKLGMWEELNVEIVGTASDGKEAFAIIKKTKPKILLTDIRMPVMDGLELIKKVKEFDEGIKVILLSGYDDFSYAQQAVKLGAQEYLLKPADIETIREAVLRAREQILSEESRFLESLKLRQKLKESMPLLRAEYFRNLINSPVKDPDKMYEKLNYLGVSLDVCNFRVLAASVDDYEKLSGLYSLTDLDLLIFAIINIIEETLACSYKCAVYKNSVSEVVIILNEPGDECGSDVFTAAETCKDRIREYLGLSVSFGIGRRYREPGGIHLSYKEALNAVNNRFVVGKGSIINISDVDVGENIRFEYPYDLAGELLQYIRIGAVQRAEEIYEAFICELYNSNTSQPALIKKYLIQFVFVLSKELTEEGLSVNGIIGNELERITALEACQTMEDMKLELKGLISSAADYIHNLKRHNEKNSVEVITNYIKNNYTKDISLNDLSKLVYMSPSYISALIKNHLGESFTERITRLRMEQAKLLLLSDEVKVYEVAEKVGYSDRRYFSDTFRKHEGCTPSEYIEKYK